MPIFQQVKLISASALAGAMIAAGTAAVLQPAAAESLAERISAIVTCSSSSVCAGWQNNGTGPAIKATGTKGAGVKATSTGASAVSGISNAKTLGAVYGESDSGSGYGVYGTSKGGSGVGVYGAGGSGLGVEATSTGSEALIAVSSSNDGVDGLSSGSSSGGMAGVFAHDTSTNALNYGVNAWSDNGIAIRARDISGTTALRVDSGTTGSGNPVVMVNASNGSNVAYIDDIGNMFITGEISTGGSCSGGCIMYTVHTPVPTTEETGDAVLQSGRANVRLSPALAATVQRHGEYRVFLTPMGESNGLYVQAKTMTGFTVTENHGGRSNIAFSYRIVARSLTPTLRR